MRIDRIRSPLIRPASSASPGGEQAVGGKSFADIMQQQGGNPRDPDLARTLDQIQQQADRLARSMNVRELHEYKRMVKRYLERTARRGIGLKGTKGRDRSGKDRAYLLLDEIDRELVLLADELLDSEQGRLALLTSIGEIRGLLFQDFY
ncbi:YaaR family protein [Gorillibacterium sp. CAU 1737]|uniref:YaaR family protein n=1 Tax=Gorillibacterium sp. CAU 1737 TaxID=3140362 RepID=UPI003260A607